MSRSAQETPLAGYRSDPDDPPPPLVPWPAGAAGSPTWDLVAFAGDREVIRVQSAEDHDDVVQLFLDRPAEFFDPPQMLLDFDGPATEGGEG